MESRIKLLQSRMLARGLDAYLVTADVDVSYLTRFAAAESWLLVLPRQSFYITDFRYAQEARAGLRGIPVRASGPPLATCAALLRQKAVRRLGLDSRRVTVAFLNRLKKARPAGTRLLMADGLVEQSRIIKDPEEVRRMQDCIALNQRVFQYARRIIRPGRSEADLLRRLEGFVRAHGAAFSFPPIVAAGDHSALPHARVTDRRLRARETVLLDLGIDIGGYKSDLTRMFFLGKISPLTRRVLAAVEAAQAAALDVIRPGVAAAAVDQAARHALQQAGLARYFGHSLGHGVGLEIHEAPSISPQSPAVLEPGMIFTVEPGVYLPGQFGIRLEDMVQVTADGCVVLSR